MESLLDKVLEKCFSLMAENIKLIVANANLDKEIYQLKEENSRLKDVVRSFDHTLIIGKGVNKWQKVE